MLGRGGGGTARKRLIWWRRLWEEEEDGHDHDALVGTASYLVSNVDTAQGLEDRRGDESVRDNVGIVGVGQMTRDEARDPNMAVWNMGGSGKT
jgi:hypothetical protein